MRILMLIAVAGVLLAFGPAHGKRHNRERDSKQQRCMMLPLPLMKPSRLRDWCYEMQKDMP